MKRSCRLMPVIVTILLIAASCLHAAEPATTLLTILHVNDYHGRINPSIDKDVSPQQQLGGAAYLAAMVKQARATNPGGTLLLAAGDMFQGSPASNVYRGAPVMEIMNELRFDATAVGNHEFDWGVRALEHLRKEADFPFLAANMVDRRGHLLAGMRPYVILQRRGLKIAVIGLTTQETAYKSKPDYVKGLTFLSPETVLPRLVQKVKQQGASIVILLSHLGLEADKSVAAAVPGIDVIVGGHSHTVIPKPLKMENGTIILQAGAYGLYLGVLELVIDKATGRPVNYTDVSGLKLVSADLSQTRDREVALITKKYNDRVRQRFAAIVGETSVALIRGKGTESNLGDLATDAMRTNAGTQIAFYNSGGIRANIPAGRITMEQLYTAFPFDNVLVSMTLTGEQIWKALEQAAAVQFGGLQVSGITVTYDLKKAVGERVVQAHVGTEPLVRDKVYDVVINDFLAVGGDQITALTEGKDIAYGSTLLDALAEYLRKYSPISPLIEGRIRFAE